MQALKILISLSRPRTCVIGFLAYVLGLQHADLPWSYNAYVGAVCIYIACACSNLGNTYSDRREDAANLPGRVAQMDRLGERNLLLALFGLQGFALVLAATAGWDQLLLIAITLAIVHAYSFPPLRLKARPFLGVLTFSQAVAFPFLVGRGADGFEATWHAPGETLRGLVFFAFLSLWFTAKGFFKNVPDYYGDKSAGLRTSATIFGSYRAAAKCALVLTILAYGAVVLPVALGLERQVLLVAVGWIPIAAINAVRLVRAPDSREANRVLARDMKISVGFIATLLLVFESGASTLLCIVLALAVLIFSDHLKLDSRTEHDKAPQLST